MKDRVPLYPGRVRLTPVSGQENTYDMVRADEPTQEGTPLSKATFLKDATAALFGLDATAVPDDALAVLSRFHNGLGNEYVWEKSKQEWVVSQAESATSIQANTQNTKKLRYSDSYTLGSDGSITLNNPVEVTPTTSNYASVPLAGKYFQEANWSTGVYETAVYYSNQNLVLNSPYVYAYGYLLSTTLDVASYGYVNSPDANAYPPAVSDGYTYTALGQLGAGLKMELLWENADPLSYFPGQTIPMDLSGVSQIMVMFRWDNTSDRDYVSKQLVIPVGGKGRNQEYGNNGVRTITVSTTGVTFSDDSKRYTYDQPWYIYGIKGVTA